MKHTFQFSSQKILITGAGGFIGTHLCKRLIQSGLEVHGTSRKIQNNYIKEMHWHSGDLINIEILRKLLSNIKPDIIFHLASYVTGSRDLKLVIPTMQSNLVSTVNLLTVATEIGCSKIILAGSLEEPDSNNIEKIPCSPYASAKWASSSYARMFFALYKTPVVIARIFMVYGPGQQDLEKLIPYVTLSLLNNTAPKLSSCRRHVDWIFIDDLINGLIAIAKSLNIEGCTIDLGSGQLVSIHKVVDLLLNKCNPAVKPLFGALPDRPMEQVKVANISDTFNRVGWKPNISLEKGLALTADWYKSYIK